MFIQLIYLERFFRARERKVEGAGRETERERERETERDRDRETDRQVHRE